MFKLLQDFYNNHRLSRKQMPEEEKLEFIKKSKEFSLFKVKYLYLKDRNFF
jgi:hypothetical protein